MTVSNDFNCTKLTYLCEKSRYEEGLTLLLNGIDSKINTLSCNKEMLKHKSANNMRCHLNFLQVKRRGFIESLPGEKAPETLEDLRVWQEKRIKLAENFEGNFKLESLETEMYSGIAIDRFILNLEMKSKIDGKESISKNQCVWIWEKVGGGEWKLATAIWNEF